MKKFTVLFTVLTLLAGNSAFAQTGQGANAGSSAGSDGMAWGVGLGALAVLATVVGITAASAASSPSTFSH